MRDRSVMLTLQMSEGKQLATTLRLYLKRLFCCCTVEYGYGFQKLLGADILGYWLCNGGRIMATLLTLPPLYMNL